MHQPDQSPIFWLLISVLRAALLSSKKKKKKNLIYYKDLGHDNCWYPVLVSLCVCMCVHSHMPQEAVPHQKVHA